MTILLTRIPRDAVLALGFLCLISSNILRILIPNMAEIIKAPDVHTLAVNGCIKITDLVKKNEYSAKTSQIRENHAFSQQN